MQQHTQHDTSTQAMTEVALGLSMAFFCLLILALFSIGLPNQSQTNPASLNKEEQLSIADNNQKNSPSDIPTNEQQYIFHFNGQFYDQQLNIITSDKLEGAFTGQRLILAVSATLPLKQLMAIRTQINHPNLSITMLNQKWQAQLEQMQ